MKKNNLLTAITSFWSKIKLEGYSNLFNINILIVLVSISVRFIYGLMNDLDSLIGFSISLLISALISTYVLNNFKYSKNIVLRFLQKMIIFNIIILFILFIFYYFSSLLGFIGFTSVYCSSGSIEDSLSQSPKSKEILSITLENDSSTEVSNEENIRGEPKNTNDNNDHYVIKLNKNALHNTAKVFVENAGQALKHFGENWAAGAAGGASGVAMVKATSGMAPLPRVALVGSTALVATTGVKVGQEIGKAITSNDIFANSMKESPHSNPDPERIPSPDPDIINSPLENGDLYSPLEIILISMLKLNVLTIILMIILLLLLFYRYFLEQNINIISSFVNKFMSNNFKEWYFKKINSGLNYKNKFVLIMFIIISILLIIFICMNIYANLELINNIDKYILVYNAKYK